jgi:ATP-dependent Clp protease ATP-binding subunit ClpA
MIPTSFSQCPTCKGVGVMQQEGGALTCQTCGGTGIWLETKTGVKLVYNFPALRTPFNPSAQRISRILRYTLSIVSFALTLGTAGSILFNARSFYELIWKADIAHLIFGLSGLTSMYALSLFEQHQTSECSLFDLEQEVAEASPGQTITITPYANKRVEGLLQKATTVAAQLQREVVDEGVLLLALLYEPRIQMMIARLELPPVQLTDALRKLLANGPTIPQSVTYAPQVRERIYQAFSIAEQAQFPYLDIEDILLAYAGDPREYSGLFQEFHITSKQLFAAARWYAGEQERIRQWSFWLERGRARPKGFMNRAWTALPTPFLDQFSVDITKRAAAGALPSATVRKAEIARALEILSSTNHNNVLFVGEPGVGKDTIVGGIALRMIEEQVPEVLKDKRLIEVDLSQLLTRGDAEQNVQQMLAEVSQAGNVMLVIPEVQSLVGTSENALDAAGILSSALKQGAVQIISTATYADYHRYVESNAVLTSLLTIVEVKPASVEQTIDILEEEAPQIESKHQVRLTYPAIEHAAQLAERYLTDQVLPMSALTLLGESAAMVHNRSESWVRKEDVEKTIETKTSIPVGEATAAESDKLLHLEETLHSRVVGQKEAVDAVANALRRARAGLHDTKRPISSFLFVGPTGVGKTETAKAIADIYFGEKSHFIRLDMSEYQDAKAVYRLIGAPAADTDSYTEGGALTQAVREHPYSLILLDEIEKAYPEVLNLFLQLLDDGRLTENTGRTVHFQNCIVVATSNAASPEIIKLMQEGVNPAELPKQILSLLQQSFKPEFLNRFDGIIPFHALTLPEIEQITSIMLRELAATVATQGITLTFAPDAITKLAQLGYDPLYGARPLRRTIQDKVEALLAKLILGKQTGNGQTLQITAEMIQ